MAAIGLTGTHPVAKRQDLIAVVAYALWEDRKRHDRPGDAVADWCRAEELIAELWEHSPNADLEKTG
jgi:hypothetical protein